MRLCAGGRRYKARASMRWRFEALARGAGVSGEQVRQRDLRDVAGIWRKDRAFDLAIADQDAIDKELWR